MNQEEKYFIENEHIPECFMYVTMDAWASVGIPLLHIIEMYIFPFALSSIPFHLARGSLKQNQKNECL